MPSRLFQQVLRMALELGAMKPGRVAIDGSKLKANASKHKAMSYQRMKEQEQRLREEVRRLLSESRSVDVEEDAQYGADKRGTSCRPNAAAGRTATTYPGSEASAGRAGPSRGESRRQGQGRTRKSQASPEDAVQLQRPGIADSERTGRGRQGYNAQIAVEPVWQLIVGQGVTQEANDKRQLLPMLRQVKEQPGQKPAVALADNGYFSEENLKGAVRMQVDAYVATGKQKHNKMVSPCPRGPIPKTATILERMRRKLQTILGRKSTPGARRSLNRCSDRSSTDKGFGSSCCGMLTKYLECG